MAPQRTGPAGPFPASFGIDDALAFIASEPAFWIGARPPTAVKCAKSSSPAVRIDTLEGLEALYGSLGEASTAKVADRVTPEYRALIAASPFAALATVGPEGLDCSPRGDLPGFVRVHDERTLMLPDRRGNNRVDSLRNVVRDPRVALMFLIPGWGNALRVNGRAHLDADGGLLASFAVEGTTPRSVVVVEVGEVYFQCARAVIRAGLWDPARHADPRGLPPLAGSWPR